MEKTPASRLLEMCVHQGLKPEYTLLAVEGVVHEPNFMFRVSLKGFTATGEGASKKKAKQLASQELLKILINQDQIHFDRKEIALIGWSPNDLQEEDGGQEVVPNLVNKNSVSILQEICARIKWKPPHYEVNEKGGHLANEKFFLAICTLEDYGCKQTEGISRTKRQAKKAAADEMVAVLEANPEITDLLNAKRKDDLNIDSVNTPSLESTLDATSAKTLIDNFYEEIKQGSSSKMGNVLSMIEQLRDSIQQTNDVSDDLDSIYDIDYIKFLKRIAEELNCKVKIVELPLLSKKEKFQCLIHLISPKSPVPVLSGWGADFHDSEVSKLAAAKKTILMLPYLMKSQLEAVI